jgi:hypothetical protein
LRTGLRLVMTRIRYFVLSLGLYDQAVLAFENVASLAPEEPQSQTGAWGAAPTPFCVAVEKTPHPTPLLTAGTHAPDLAFARFFRLREQLGSRPTAAIDPPPAKKAAAQAEIRAVIDLLVFVIRKLDIPRALTVHLPLCPRRQCCSAHVVCVLWCCVLSTDRFAEIEWPVLLLLSWVVSWAEVRYGCG